MGRAPINPSSERARLRCGWSSPQLRTRNGTHHALQMSRAPGPPSANSTARKQRLEGARGARRGAEGSGRAGGGAHAPMLRSPPLKHRASPPWRRTRRLRSRGRTLSAEDSDEEGPGGIEARCWGRARRRDAAGAAPGERGMRRAAGGGGGRRGFRGGARVGELPLAAAKVIALDPDASRLARFLLCRVGPPPCLRG